MDVPVITLKQAEKAVRKYSFRIKKSKFYSKKDQEKADKFEEKHGFRYEDCWNLETSIALFILPRLVHLRDTTHGYPGEFAGEADGMEKWEKILNEMIYGFYIYVTKDPMNWSDEDKKNWFRAKCWLCRYFCDLWD